MAFAQGKATTLGVRELGVSLGISSWTNPNKLMPFTKWYSLNGISFQVHGISLLGLVNNTSTRY